MNKLFFLLVALFLLYTPIVSAQIQSGTGFRMDGGLGKALYTENDLLNDDQRGGNVWSMSLKVMRWWDIKPRLSIGAGLGAQLNYFHLQCRNGLDELSPLMGLELAEGENEIRLVRSMQFVPSATVDAWGEYTLIEGKGLRFRLLGGATILRSFATSVNTVYRRPRGGALINFNTETTASEPAVNDYFNERLPDWRVNLHVGIAMYVFGQNSPQDQVFLYCGYDHGLSPMMQGLSQPVRGIRGGLGMRFDH